MCGIFGIIAGDSANITQTEFKIILNNLLLFSQSRGSEATGIATLEGQTIDVYKKPVSPTRFIRDKKFKNMISEMGHPDGVFTDSTAVIGHSRLVTNGTQSINKNNQPIVKDNLVGVHNGIIVNEDSLWKRFPELKRTYEVDTEVILSLIQMFLKNEKPMEHAAIETFGLIQGSASLAILLDNSTEMLLATNTGSLFLSRNIKDKVCIFASEKYILEKIAKKRYSSEKIDKTAIFQVKPGEGVLLNTKNLEMKRFSLTEKGHRKDKTSGSHSKKSRIYNIIDRAATEEKALYSLQRCVKCILPETMPFINFDKDGICNYCNNYKKISFLGQASLEATLEKYRSKTASPDCIVPFSGGRDSSYALHFLKRELGMNPIAYTYDWGMVSDLARRNQARICGKLGIEHIVISADIKKKRKYIRLNVEAWQKKPDLGVIPLFMAGDKQLFYYANRLKKQTGIKLAIFGMNMLEKTDFKVGFCGLDNVNNTEKHYTLPILNKMILAKYYAKQYLLNPSYLNRSLFDTLFAYFSYYFTSHDYVLLYQYVKWDENEINATLINEYDWETAKDTKTTWRIGDGTVPFYNYIYHTVAGFTESDTFRSNQIREGLISRDEALALTNEENKPRFEAIRQYCNLIGINYDEIIPTINSIPKLYLPDS